MKKHKFNIFPIMKAEDVTRLKKDLQDNGYDRKQPIYLYEGDILDGWNRYVICQELGIEPVYKNFEDSPDEALAYVMRTNHRRNLTSSQWACIAVEAEELHEVLRAEARKRQVRGGKKKVKQLIAEAKPEDNETRSKLASAFNTNRTYIDQAKKIKEAYPEKAEEVLRGDKSLTQASREIRHEEAKEHTPAMPSGKYRVLYADPPWKYNDSLSISKTGLGEGYGPADAHYPPMTISELCLLPIEAMAEDNAVLFLWTTSPLLEETFQIIKAWGFKYKTSFVWDKVKHNMGHYNSVRHEFLLVCTKGSCTPDVKTLFDSVVSVERTKKHSEKPQAFREIIEAIYTRGKKIELFARGSHKGWETWGNEAL